MRSLAKTDRDVVEFLWRPQVRARRVAKAMLEHVHAARMGKFSAAAAEMMPPVNDAVFPRLPADRGHFRLPYMAHILCGLRHRLPDYVQDVLDGRTPPPWVTARRRNRCGARPRTRRPGAGCRPRQHERGPNSAARSGRPGRPDLTTGALWSGSQRDTDGPAYQVTSGREVSVGHDDAYVRPCAG